MFYSIFCIFLFLQFFYFSSQAFLPSQGQFAGRIEWQGSPARGEASISLINATLNDNGTFTCSVRNPPDVHGSPSSHTVLTVTPKCKETKTISIYWHTYFIVLSLINTWLFTSCCLLKNWHWITLCFVLTSTICAHFTTCGNKGVIETFPLPAARSAAD